MENKATRVTCRQCAEIALREVEAARNADLEYARRVLRNIIGEAGLPVEHESEHNYNPMNNYKQAIATVVELYMERDKTGMQQRG